MPVFTHPEFDHHEKVMFCHDPRTGLRGIIAVHSTTLGPAAGGCRMHPYETVEDALTDVLRLSKGMSYKNALAGIPLGGGKCVIIADPTSPKKADLLRAFGRHVQSLGGRYWTAIDIGVGPEDADVLAETCDYVFARASQYSNDFSASHFTALGGFVGIRAAASFLWGRTDLNGLRVAIQGLGSTGHEVARLLHESGAELVVTDVRDEAIRRVVDSFGARAVAPEAIHAQDVDIFAPCAMGAVINDRSVPELRAKAVCGVANNQLAEPRHGAALDDRGIAYVPDYVVNAGGMLGASALIYTKPSHEAAIERIHGLHDTIVSILQRARAERRPSSEIADDMARGRILAAAETR